MGCRSSTSNNDTIRSINIVPNSSSPYKELKEEISVKSLQGVSEIREIVDQKRMISDDPSIYKMIQELN